MINNRSIKGRSRILLNGHHTKLASFTILYLLCLLLSSLLPSYFFSDMSTPVFLLSAGLLNYLLTVFVNLVSIGISRALLCICKEENYGLSDLFFAFTHNSDLFLKMQLIMTAVHTLLSLPILFLSYFVADKNISTLEYTLIYYSLVLLAALLSMLILLPLSFAPFLAIENPDSSLMECFKESCRLTKGYRLKLFWLQISFAGMYLLSIASMFTGFLFTLPYMRCANVLFFKDLQNRKRG